MSAPDLSTRQRAVLDAMQLAPAKAQSDVDVLLRLDRVEGAVRAARAIVAAVALSVVGAATHLIVTLTRVEERYDRLARDVTHADTASAHAKETSDRLTERLAAMGDRVERIDRAVTQTLPAIQASIEALRLDLVSSHATPRR